ncbi:hypothetical protein PF005_g21310 [Phytophthora fragariae]|uniref:Uncharacterized protein n=1 Tax=Phytophthora fragariae TaxID=53985 RepID=A0A6A3XWY0_9STRA|nr:hypothetical protein PF003_g668 [Phytophthora fragariae]KAE8930997.1 hypothetical protein PF009_g18931 [Phytophthora fragariae]KAE9087856.1 hypothetical protein PF010_g19574 [Phytophthora fragariae]KAE9115836.1 hypothetical protein PF006_g19186 [Phytophthora fragariae]KAE9185309.1 hypothetical protein PF005_g21310 [Phytophthora fragariae]
MKTKVQAAMARRQERLYVQRRQLALQQHQERLRNDEEAQRAARGRPSQQVADWWRQDDDENATRQDSTCWSMTSDRSDETGVGRATVDAGGCLPVRSIDSGRTVGSWKTPRLMKSCNRAAMWAPDDARNDGRNGRTMDQSWSSGPLTASSWQDGEGSVEVPPSSSRHASETAGSLDLDGWAGGGWTEHSL